jgi:predicted HTH transcriptional regulator
MFDSQTELIEKIRLGEDSFFEMKEVRFAGSKIKGPGRDELSDELGAFANAKGGVCLLGVDDTSRELIGIPIERLDSVEAYVREVANDTITPPLPLTIERIVLPSSVGKTVPLLKITVDRSLFVHKSSGGYLYRVGSSKRQMPPDFLGRLFQQRSQSRIIRFDEQVVSAASLDDFDSKLVDRFRTERSGEDRAMLMQKLGLIRSDETSLLKPTVAGVLLATREPRRWISNAYVQAVAYRGVGIEPESDKPYQLDAADLTGPLDEQIVESCRFVMRNMRVSATKVVGRIDRPDFDMTAIFEAVVNAVAHRDYSMYGSKVRLRLFSDRLELYSPGMLPNTMTVDSLAYRQASRNETITSLLAKCALPNDEWLTSSRATMMDRRGEGVSIILDRSERLSGQRPTYDVIDDAELRLTIYAANREHR